MNDKIDERTISSIDHQYDMARLERIIKRLWIVILSLLILFAGTNALWIYEWNQYDYGEITVDSDNGGNAKYMLVSVNYFLTSNSWHTLTSPSSEGLFLLRVFNVCKCLATSMCLVKLFQNSYKFLLTLCVSERIIFMTDTRRCFRAPLCLENQLFRKL